MAVHAIAVLAAKLFPTTTTLPVTGAMLMYLIPGPASAADQSKRLPSNTPLSTQSTMVTPTALALMRSQSRTIIRALPLLMSSCAAVREIFIKQRVKTVFSALVPPTPAYSVSDRASLPRMQSVKWNSPELAPVYVMYTPGAAPLMYPNHIWLTEEIEPAGLAGSVMAPTETALSTANLVDMPPLPSHATLAANGIAAV